MGGVAHDFVIQLRHQRRRRIQEFTAMVPGRTRRRPVGTMHQQIHPMTAVVQHQLAIVQSGAGRQLGLAGIHDKADTTAAKILHLHLYTVAVVINTRIAQPQCQLAMQAAGPPSLSR